MARYVRFDAFGGPEVFRLVEGDIPRPGHGEVRVRVIVAGLNPVDYKLAASPEALASYGRELPSGNGNDFAGVVDGVGTGVTGFATGDRVYGGHRFFAQADFLTAPADILHHLPPGLTLEQAGALDIAGRAALASVAAVGVGPRDTVLVSAAAGGVGVLAAQLAKRAGAVVLGTAGDRNQEFLRGLGVIPVLYGDGLRGRVEAAAPAGITAVVDTHGRETLQLAVDLGVAPERVNTIADRPFAAEHGFSGVGGQAATLDQLAELGEWIGRGEIVLPIDSVWPMERVVDAYRHLIDGRIRGKVVLVTE
ncbi:NADP-dependent oxidoreductase [Plantibacter flavus]|uniref:NADP-dependent oxidoreductase n=1 Tax=Plantibacter flavus TaxID=150123 RepID=UPI003F163694